MDDIDIINKEAAVLYFTTPDCNVCKVLKPKVKELLKDKFPKISFLEIDATKRPDISGQFEIFTVPVILVFFEGKEFLRKARNISILELEREIARPYGLLFE